MKSRLTRSDYEEFLIDAYFAGLPSKAPDYLISCIQTAYLDCCRTLRGVGQVKCKDELRRKAVCHLKQRFVDLQDGHKKLRSQEEFDAWHKDTCAQLSKIYEGYHTLYVGQAQKWVNMTFKYIFTMGECRLPGFSDVYQLCHVPIDNVLIDRLSTAGIHKSFGLWSQIEKYEAYLEYQRRIRRRFQDIPPLDVEFRLWLGQPLNMLNKDSETSADQSPGEGIGMKV